VDLYRWLPTEAVKILLVLFLSFLIGLEREEHKAEGGHYAFGGVRTFPLIGLIGYSIALLSGAQLIPLMLGFLVVGSFLSLSYWHKLSTTEAAGVTSEMSGLATYLVGALVYYDHFWIATALSVGDRSVRGREDYSAQASPLPVSSRGVGKRLECGIFVPASEHHDAYSADRRIRLGPAWPTS